VDLWLYRYVLSSSTYSPPLLPADAPTAFGEPYHFMGQLQPARPDHLAFAQTFWELTADLLRGDRLRLGPLVHLREGGLDGIPDGLAELEKGSVSGGKLVYVISDHE